MFFKNLKNSKKLNNYLWDTLLHLKLKAKIDVIILSRLNK